MLPDLLVADGLRTDERETLGRRVDPRVEPVRARNLDRDALGVVGVGVAAVGLLC